MERAEESLLFLARDAGNVLDDYLGSFVRVARGDLGGEQRSGVRGAIAERLQRGVVRRLGAYYAGDQLRRTAAAADEFVAAIDALRDEPSPPVASLLDELDGRGVSDILRMLRADSAPTGGGPLDAHRRLNFALGEIRKTEMLLTVQRMREQRNHPT
jgi:hypothetical protein